MERNTDDTRPNRRRVLELGVSLSTFLGVAALEGCTSDHDQRPPASFEATTPNPEVKSGQKLDLLTDQQWSMAGVEKIGNNRLYIGYENMRIVKKDGSDGRENPPVNLFGMHLNVRGNFSLTASLDFSGYAGEGAITLYGRPPIIYDEQRYDDKTLRIALQNGSFWVGLTDGTHSQEPKIEKEYQINQNSQSTISITRQDNHLAFGIVTGKDETNRNIVKTLGSIPESGLFDSGQLWFGLDAGGPGGWTLKDTNITPLDGGTIEVVDTSKYKPMSKDQDSLNVLVEKRRANFRIGAATALAPMVSDARYAELVLGGNFGIMTPENAMKFQFIHPQQDRYSFQEADALMTIADQNGIKIHGHTLDFAEANPEWVRLIAKNHPNQLQSVLESHITTVVGHYGDKVMDWDVVNEPLANYDTTPGQYGLRRSIWYDAMGASHIDIALRAVHQANPNANLWINEFGLEFDDDRFHQMISLIERLKSNNTPLYGIGFQMHVTKDDTVSGGHSIDKEKLRLRIRTLADLGVKARISELDVSSDQEQGIFSEVLEVCINEPNCTDVTFWGATDKYSSSGGLNSQGRLELGIGLPWDARFRPTAAVSRMKQILKHK